MQVCAHIYEYNVYTNRYMKINAFATNTLVLRVAYLPANDARMLRIGIFQIYAYILKTHLHKNS